MSENIIFGVEEAIQHFGIKPTTEQLVTLATIPFSENVLKECKDTHILVAAFPLSILDIREKVERSLFYLCEDAWYNDERFAHDKGEVGWHLVRKTILPKSTDKKYPDQQKLLADTEETPAARIMVYTIIGHYLATGERLLKRVYARCSDLDSDGYCLLVGRFGADGLYLLYYPDDGRNTCLGLASSRKF